MFLILYFYVSCSLAVLLMKDCASVELTGRFSYGFDWTTKGWKGVNKYVKKPNFSFKHKTFSYLKAYLI